MNIDLLLTAQGEAGLVSDNAFPSPVAGIMFDARTGIISLEFTDTEPLELNIPLEEQSIHALGRIPDIHVGVIEQSMVADSRQVPVVLLNDPFGGGNAGHFPVKPRQSIAAFENFMKRCVTGQPVHRDDLGDEACAKSVLGGMNTAILQFAPHLARQRTLEASPNLAHTPQAPGMGLGGPGGTGSGSARPAPHSPRRQNSQDDDELG